MKDNRDPELVGLALLSVPRAPGQRLSEALEQAGQIDVADFGTAEALLARSRLNGQVRRASERLSGS